MAASAEELKCDTQALSDRVQPLLTDLYQFTMAYSYWKCGKANDSAVFEIFFRENPFGGEYALFAGLTDCLQFLSNFQYTQEDLDYLESVLPCTVEKDFFEYLKTVDASEVALRSVPEGSVVFARVPLIEVQGPLLVVQLLETTLLCLVNYASLVATNAARFRIAAGPDKKLIELGLRRAQGPDGGLSASRYSYIGGFDKTSNVLAGKLYGIPVTGTVAHSFISSFNSMVDVKPRTLKPATGDKVADLVSLCENLLPYVCHLLKVPLERLNQGELAAFISYAISFPKNFLVLVDTYNVMWSGVPNFCTVALALAKLGYQAVGIRLDSGDLAQQSVVIRRIFQTCSIEFQFPWFMSLSITVSNNINEKSLLQFNQQENSIDVIGVGTHLVTCPLQSSLGYVCKLVELNGSPRIKLTEDTNKITLPGRKTVYRLFDASGHCFLDLLALKDEPSLVVGQEVECQMLGKGEGSVRIVVSRVETMHQDYFREAKICSPLPSVMDVREYSQCSLLMLGEEHKRLSKPKPYKVAITEKLYRLLNNFKIANGSSHI
ncbi:nicotinate phosphoribosyltransferase [Protopterus annectens]|uniref:nicotinate phosphoribosyltransferase n=1 Tax=Protopterus annectens TaxID=7888 RepID=UPI001CF9D78B|nr:nicotinate phosphoribosyltransferase [Protopterus annectens]